MTKPIARDAIYRKRVFDADIIELCVRWYITYRLSYRDLVEMMADRGVQVSHSTILRWVSRYVPEFERRWNRFSKAVGTSWRWTRRTFRSKRSGTICIERSTRTAKASTFCSAETAASRPLKQSFARRGDIRWTIVEPVPRHCARTNMLNDRVQPGPTGRPLRPQRKCCQENLGRPYWDQMTSGHRHS